MMERRWWLALVLAACSAPVNEAGGGSDATSSATDETTDATTASSTASSTATSSPTSTSQATEDVTGTESGTGTETGVVGACGPGNCVEFPPSCGEACGTLRSPFDADGCLRTGCGSDRGCAADEACFIGAAFGECVSSGMSCADSPEDMLCVCNGDPDCNGGYCVPDSIYPVTEPGPAGEPRILDLCDEGFEQQLLAEGDMSDCGAGDPILQLAFAAPLAAASFSANDFGGSLGMIVIEGEPLAALGASVTLTEIDPTAAGDYSVNVLGTDGTLHVYAADFADASVCPCP